MIVGKRLGMFLAVLVLLAGGLAACGGGDDDDGGGGDGNGDDAAVSEIQQLYIDVGCAECHGENGEGDGANPKTEIAGTPHDHPAVQGACPQWPGFGDARIFGRSDHRGADRADVEWLRE
ncbi:MAG: c-type cytochrome [Thermomicrobiales bacterium]